MCWRTKQGSAWVSQLANCFDKYLYKRQFLCQRSTSYLVETHITEKRFDELEINEEQEQSWGRRWVDIAIVREIIVEERVR